MDDRRPEKPCPVCRRPFLARRPWGKFCSPGCRLKAWHVKKVDEILKKVREELVK